MHVNCITDYLYLMFTVMTCLVVAVWCVYIFAQYLSVCELLSLNKAALKALNTADLNSLFPLKKRAGFRLTIYRYMILLTRQML